MLKTIKSPLKRRAPADSWQDVCFIHSIPGQDSEEGVLVLCDSSLGRLIQCKGINALYFDDAEKEKLARAFAVSANAIDADLQFIVSSSNLSVDEYFSRYQNQIDCDDQYLRWYADYTDKWFRRVQEVSFIPQREFYVLVSYMPDDSSGRKWKGRRSIQKHEEYLSILDRYTKSVCEQLRQSNLSPLVCTRAQFRNLICRHLNPRQSEFEPQAPPSNALMTEASVLARSGLKATDNYLWLDSKFTGTMFMHQLPHETWFGCHS